MNRNGNRPKIAFEIKLAQVIAMITDSAETFRRTRITKVTDSWFGNNGLWKPLHDKLGLWVDMLSRLRSNTNIFELPGPYRTGWAGRPKKYGRKLGSVPRFRPLASKYIVNLYGCDRTVFAYERVAMLKSIRCAVKVVWICRQTQWVALYTTGLTLSARQIIEYYGARRKIEALFKELKHDIGSAEMQTRHLLAVTNHLHFCMLATSIAWIYATRIDKMPTRWHAVDGRNHFAFSDVRRLVTKAILADNFVRVIPTPGKFVVNSLAAVILRLAA